MSVTVDVRELVRAPGSARRDELDEPIPGLATELARVPEDRSVHADLLFEGVVEGILVSGSIRGIMSFSCARCLNLTDSAFDLPVQELFVPGAGEADDEYPLPEEGVLDLEPMIRDAVVLAMPFAPLCRPGCRGLCARCGGDLNLGECTCPPEADARWGALQEIDWGGDPSELSRDRREEH